MIFLLIGGRIFLAARNDLNVRISKYTAFLKPKSFFGKQFSGDQFYTPVLPLLLDVY